VSVTHRLEPKPHQLTASWFVVRYFEGLTERDRVVIRSRPYNIRFIANLDMADRWLEISVDLGAAV